MYISPYIHVYIVNSFYIHVGICISLAKHTLYIGCSSFQFRCSNGECISSSLRCNGRSGGCSDGSDETGCSTSRLLSNGQTMIQLANVSHTVWVNQRQLAVRLYSPRVSCPGNHTPQEVWQRNTVVVPFPPMHHGTNILPQQPYKSKAPTLF